MFIDLEVGPFSSAEEIKAEIQRIEQMPESEERDDALATLLEWLARQE